MFGNKLNLNFLGKTVSVFPAQRASFGHDWGVIVFLGLDWSALADQADGQYVLHRFLRVLPLILLGPSGVINASNVRCQLVSVSCCVNFCDLGAGD